MHVTNVLLPSAYKRSCLRRWRSITLDLQRQRNWYDFTADQLSMNLLQV